MVREIARDQNVPLVDIWRLFEDFHNQAGKDRDDLMLDSMHPNDLGQAMIAEELKNQILIIKSN